jgi:hypothetical protein
VSGSLTSLELPMGSGPQTISMTSPTMTIVPSAWTAQPTWIANGGVGDAEIWLSNCGALTYRVKVRVTLAPADRTPVQSRRAHLGMILPFTNDGVELEGITWKQVICGATLAVSHVNAGNETVVPGLRGLVSNLERLDSSMHDTGCTACGGSKHS